MSKLFLTVAASLLLLPDNVWARSWTEIDPLHGMRQPDFSAMALMVERDPLTPPEPTSSPTTTPTAFPNTATPSQEPTESPSFKPTPSPTDAPSASPVQPPDPYPENAIPWVPGPSYFNYNTTVGSEYGPGHIGFSQVDNKMVILYKENSWTNVEPPSNSYWKEFDRHGFGAWKGVLESRQPDRNRCGRVGLQSPIDVRANTDHCPEFHEVRSLRGDFALFGDKVEKQIQSNKLRLKYTRRPCSDLSRVECQEPDPPSADFPNGWGGFADAMHVDFKVPAEHKLNGHRYDAEMQIYHLHPGRRRMPTQAVLISATDDGHNSYFDHALRAFEYEYENDLAQCARKIRRERRLVSDFHNTLAGDNFTSEFEDYTTWGEYSTEMDRPDYEEYASEMERKLQVIIWDPHHKMLIPTIHFYRYEGSLTEPPCGEFVSWFIADIPMVISKAQLEKLKMILFNHVAPSCKRTSVHFEQSVARPIQETAGRPVYRCTADDFGPD